jgi:hypothetical protein
MKLFKRVSITRSHEILTNILYLAFQYVAKNIEGGLKDLSLLNLIYIKKFEYSFLNMVATLFLHLPMDDIANLAPLKNSLKKKQTLI